MWVALCLRARCGIAGVLTGTPGEGVDAAVCSACRPWGALRGPYMSSLRVAERVVDEAPAAPPERLERRGPLPPSLLSSSFLILSSLRSSRSTLLRCRVPPCTATDAALDPRATLSRACSSKMQANNARAIKSEIQSLEQKLAECNVSLKDNLEKIKLNKQLPYLVANVVEVRAARVFSFAQPCLAPSCRRPPVPVPLPTSRPPSPPPRADVGCSQGRGR